MSAIFEPEWSATIGKIKQSGKGLLPKDLHSLRSEIDEFCVSRGDVTIRVFPKIARVHLEGALYFQAIGGQPMGLTWSRTMEFSIGTSPGCASQTECLHYTVGLVSDGVPVWSMQIADDCRILSAL